MCPDKKTCVHIRVTRVCVVCGYEWPAHHLRAQVHLRLAGREGGTGRAAQQHGLLGDTGGGGADALGPADELSCGRGRGQVDLRTKG